MVGLRRIICDAHRETPIDLFVAEPFPFDEEYQRALIKPLYAALEVRFVSISTLIRMKELAGRPQVKSTSSICA